MIKLPVNFAAYLKLEPRKLIFINALEGSDLTCIFSQVTDELLEQVRQRKLQRIEKKHEGGQDIMKIKDWILIFNAQSETELVNAIYPNPQYRDEFEHIYCKQSFSRNFKKALTFAIQVVLDKPYQAR
ncbi:hypothetical protein TNIN_354231 [Trichonephila inaurata madagascariensis]|uniref:Uncharacterized protein n=1 Tax=Trichonephila inaurata madagascariensis TaxID=2747483 RepID=A0A8X6XMV7_9ARAC|nr:hypothetical protein TNIN_354231 [Trichonephila inaurata madagascariensis]